MEYDAFIGGIEPGGLRNKNEIRILICYMLTSVGASLSKDGVIAVLQENGFANYFETADAISDLLENGNIAPDEADASSSHITDSGRMIARQLDVTLPFSVRERALSATLNLLARIKREAENQVHIKKCDRGYQVDCHISGGDMDLMSFTLYVPDLLQAKLVRSRFQEDPERVYRCMLALVTGNADLVSDALRALSGEQED